MSFPWMTATHGSKAGADRRLAEALRELRERAALLARLGYPAAAAVARLQARVVWDFDPPAKHGGPHVRPTGLSDAAIAQLVTETYQRHAPR